MKTIACVKCAHELRVEADWPWEFKQCPVCGAKTMLPAEWQKLPELPPTAEPTAEPSLGAWQPPAASAAPPAPLDPIPARGILGRIFCALGGLLILAAGLVFVAIELMGLVDFLGRDSRLVTEGTISEVGVRSDRSRGRVRITSYTPRVSFTYVVNGKNHAASRIAFWEQLQGSQSVAERIKERYPRNTHRKVYYRADNPADGVLDTGWKWQPLWLAAAGLCAIALGVRIVASNLVSDQRARTTRNGLLTRRWTAADIAITATLIVLGAFFGFNLCWFE